MSEEQEKIVFTTDTDEEVEFYVIDETKINGINYLLVADSNEEEADALILKEETVQGDSITYDIIENDDELEAVSKVFIEMSENLNITME